MISARAIFISLTVVGLVAGGAAAYAKPAPSPVAPGVSGLDSPDEPAISKPRPSKSAKASASPTKTEWRPGRGLRFASDDGRFGLHTSLRIQLRYTADHDRERADDRWLQSFQARRARLLFCGWLYNKHNTFKTELAFSPRDLGMKDGQLTRTPLLSWYLEFDYLRDLTLRVGQYKVPYSRQRVISSGKLQLVDRSLANAEFNLDRDIGLDLRSTDLFGLGLLRYALFAGVGEGRDGYEADDFGMLFIARLEVLPFGLFQSYDEVDFERGKRPRLALGAAYAYLGNAKRNRGIVGSTPADGGTTDTHNITADLLFKWHGVTLYSEVFWRSGSRTRGNAVDEQGWSIQEEAARDGYGGMLQVGWLLPKINLEVAARYGTIRPKDDASSLPEQNEAGGGISYYAERHSLKLQADYFRLWGEGPAPAGGASKGPLSGGRHQIRIQLQAAF